MSFTNDLRSLSLYQSGQVSHTWIYWVSKGKHFRRSYVVPYDPKSLKQIEQRNKFYFAIQMYRKLSASGVVYWNKLAKDKRLKMSGFNLFISVKIKEIKIMVKQVIRGQAALNDGTNVITIPEVYLEKSQLVYNSFATGDYDPDKKQTGILSAYISDTTHITVQARDSAGTGTVLFTWEIVEYV